MSNAFRALVASLSVRPFTTLAAFFLLSLGYVVYKSYDTLESLVVTPGEEASRFRAQLESSALVNTAIENLRVSLNAHSVVVRQFHNGRHDLTGLPFTESTTTFYTDKYSPGSDEPLSSMNTSLKTIWKSIENPACRVTYVPDDKASRKYFKEYKLIKIVECPITNLLNYPIGMITVGFSDSNTVSDEVAINRTAAIAKRITGYLNGN